MPKDHRSSPNPNPIAPQLDEDHLTAKLKDAQHKLKDSITDYEPARQKCDDDKLAILALYEKIRQESGVDNGSNVTKLSNYHRSKLKTAYNNALKDVGQETQKLRSCLDQLHELRRLREEKRRLLFKKQVQTQVGLGPGAAVSSPGDPHTKGLHRSQTTPASISSLGRSDMANGGGAGGYGLRRGALMMLLQRAAASLPLWIGEDMETPDEEEGSDHQEDGVQEAPPLCGAIPAASDHICQAGDMVAVRAKVQDGDENWILAEVKKYDQSTGKYEVEDIDEEEKERYVISKKKLIPLPKYRAHPQLNPSSLFEVNAVVWALYPQTTCFYKGVVERRPAGPNDPYLVAFEDSSYPTGYSLPLGVPQRYVIAQN